MGVLADTLNPDMSPGPQELYASRGRDYLVVWPAPAAMHGQASCYNKCLEEFRCAGRLPKTSSVPQQRAQHPACSAGAALRCKSDRTCRQIEICPSARHVFLQE